ncbi:MAG: OmpA family protein [Holosporales bacterium]|jgi:peptidoglycan-associated lipoprotein|nr:OmpA family protein [Holosporales bacterium]
MKSDKLNHIEIVLTFRRTDRIMNSGRALMLATAVSAALLAACNRKCNVDGDGGGSASVTPGSAEDFENNVPNVVYFNFDKSNLTESAQKRVEAQANWLKTYSGTKVNIAGHTDARGTAEYNMALGQARADAVSKELQKGGIEGTRISTASYGKERLFASGSEEMDHAKNRRAVTAIN